MDSEKREEKLEALKEIIPHDVVNLLAEAFEAILEACPTVYDVPSPAKRGHPSKSITEEEKSLFATQAAQLDKYENIIAAIQTWFRIEIGEHCKDVVSQRHAFLATIAAGAIVAPPKPTRELPFELVGGTDVDKPKRGKAAK